MRSLAVLVALVTLACSTAPAVTPASQSSLDAVTDFLITSAASDFHAHRPPDPARFRNVRLGHIVTSGGEPQYRLCGEFLPAAAEGEAEWTSFATIRTDPYEQWIGNQSDSFCKDKSMVWDTKGDLSPALQRRLDALQ